MVNVHTPDLPGLPGLPGGWQGSLREARCNEQCKNTEV